MLLSGRANYMYIYFIKLYCKGCDCLPCLQITGLKSFKVMPFLVNPAITRGR